MSQTEVFSYFSHKVFKIFYYIKENVYNSILVYTVNFVGHIVQCC